MVGAAGNVLPFDEEEDEELAPPQSVIQYGKWNPVNGN